MFIGYGIATPMGSMWRDEISLAILELQEKGEIQMLYDKWWKKPGDTCVRPDEGREPNRSANSLNADNIGGIFVVLLCGLSLAIIIAICEFCYNSRKLNFIEQSTLFDQDINPLAVQNADGNSTQEAMVHRQTVLPIRQSLCAEMADEFCFAIRCKGSRQRTALKRSCSKCIQNNRFELKSNYESDTRWSLPSISADMSQYRTARSSVSIYIVTNLTFKTQILYSLFSL